MITQIIFDWKRTLFDPERGQLALGAQSVLETLAAKQIDLILIGKDQNKAEADLDQAGVRRLFKAVHFVPVKSQELFRRYISATVPEATLVVGDRAQQEVAFAKSLGAKAIWLRAGKFQDELPAQDALAPDDVIFDIRSLLEAPLLSI